MGENSVEVTSIINPGSLSELRQQPILWILLLTQTIYNSIRNLGAS